MTDIQRHLKGIERILRDHLNRADLSQPFPLTCYEAIRADLRAFLPGSYGVTYGRAHNASGQQSRPMQVVVYDRPLAKQDYSPDEPVSIEHIIGVFEVETVHTTSTLQAALKRVASVKTLKTHTQDRTTRQDRPVGQRRRRIPTHRLPVTVLMCAYMDGFNPDDPNDYLALADLIHTGSLRVKPDFIHFVGQNVLYRNPLVLADRPTRPEDVALCRTPRLTKPRACYICKNKFFYAHFHYEHLCGGCGDLNYRKRVATADLSGRIALVTGGRVKIGYQTALSLLRQGAEVIVTTRFRVDAAKRYASEPDFADWRDCLHIYGLDFRHLASVQAFITHLYDAFPHVDIVINNAAQTVRRPPAYYAHLIPAESEPVTSLSASVVGLLKETEPTSRHTPDTLALLAIDGSTSPAMLSQVAMLPGDHDQSAFPVGQYDTDGQQVDNRPENSWVVSMANVDLPEMLEVQLVNVTVPSMFVSQLKPLLQQSPYDQRFIVIVSAVEGQFAQAQRGIHPHTSMAKAALNMMTHTVAPDYAESGIYMSSVDPGWVSDQTPHTSDESRTQMRQMIPLDSVDGAARVVDPIIGAVNGQEPVYGVFLKDYSVAPW